MTAEALTIEALERWELFGATWRLIEISDHSATVELCSCMGDPVQRCESTDPELIGYLRNAIRPPTA